MRPTFSRESPSCREKYVALLPFGGRIVAPNLLRYRRKIFQTMTDSKTLETLFPGARRVIVSAIFGDPDRWWSLAELAGCAGVQPGSLQGYLARLRKCGIVRERKVAETVHFQPDVSCPIFSELQAIVSKLTPSPVSGETILVVEDTEATAQITRILLESWGYLVLEAHSPSEALGLFESHADQVHLLLTDVLMPGMSGVQLADELQRRRPELRVVFMSGCPADQLGGRGDAFLPKPFNPRSLSQMVRKTLDGVSCGESH